MALVGHNCMVSRFPDGVSVGSGIKGLSNLCDENLDNYCDLPGVADVTLLAGSPIVAVKDMKHYFDKNTKAGFKISGESSLLKLDLLQKNYQIRFYKDGKTLLTSDIEQGSFSILGLSVGSVAASNTMDIVAAKQPAEDYDEIALVGGSGLNVSAVKGLKVYYAFVGENITLTETRIKDWDPAIKLEGNTNLTDDNLSNGKLLQLGLGVIITPSAKVSATKAGYDGEIFPAGMEAGFVYHDTKGLVNAGVTPVIVLLDRNGKTVHKEFKGTEVLSISLGGGDHMVSVKAPVKFSGIKFYVDGLKLGGEVTAKYAFISPEPITAGHLCTMSPTATLDICSCEEKYVLNWDKKNYPDASWEMVSTTDDNVTFDAANHTLDFGQTDSYLYGSGEKVTVVMKLKNTDDCAQEVTINYGGSNDQQKPKKEFALVNTDPANPTYVLGDGNSFGINLLSIIKNSANILSSKLNSFASYFGGVSLGDSYLCSIKKQEGMISDGSKALQAGFVVTAKGSALSADVLKMMNVRLYKGGEEVTGGVATAPVAAKLIGHQNTHKLRYAIKVPAGTQFDEIRLYSTGLLGANLSVMNIYYAYTADEDAVFDDPAEGAEFISFDKTGATINPDRTQSIGVANVGNGLKDLTNCIDGDLKTCTHFPTGVKAVSGSSLAVNLGVTATRNKQLVIVVNKKAVGLGLDVVGAIVVKTYKKKAADADPAKARKADEGASEDTRKADDSELVDTFDDWSVLGANVITRGDLGYIFINPTNDYDEVVITEGAGVSALDGLSVYGILLRNDADGDGTPDTEIPSENCNPDIVFDETNHISDKSTKRYKKNLTMYFKRTFQPEKWNSIVLPVNLTKAQFESAFGRTAKLSEARKVYQDEKSLVIGFKAVEETVVDGQTVYLRANKPYIIWVDQATVGDHQHKTFTTTDAGSITGEIYMVDKTQVDGVSYTYNEAAAKRVSETFTIGDGIDASWGLTGLQFQASYDPAQSLGIGDYGWNKGNLYHLNKAHTMKGYRCWLTPTWANPGQSHTTLNFGFGQGELTGVETAPSAEQQGELKIFNLQGQRINGLDGVQPGVYIVNGKKMVVK